MRRSYIFLFLATIAWGGGTVNGKLAVGEVSTMTLIFYRWLLVALVLLPFALPYLKRDFAAIKKHWILLFALGSCGFSVFNLLIYQALHYTSAIKVSIEQAAIPIFIMLANFLLLRQLTSRWQIIGLIIAIIGVIVTVSNNAGSSIFDEGINRGDVLMLLASLAYAAYSFGLRWRPQIHWSSFFFVLSASACLFTLPFYLGEENSTNLTTLSSKGWFTIAYFVIVSSVCAELFYAKSVALIGSNRAGQFMNMVPIFGTLLSIIILGETFYWHHGLGLILVLGGIILAEKADKAVNINL